MIGGGYGTGREVVQYFSSYGILGGLLGIGLAALAFAVLMAVSFEFARRFAAYDYRRFFRALLGPGWVAFEVLYLLMLTLVLAVICAAASKLIEEHLHVPGMLGIVVLLSLVAALEFFGKKWVTGVLAWKALILSVVFGAYFLIVIGRHGSEVVTELTRWEIREGWPVAALKYVLYSSVVIPVMLFSTKAIESRGQAMGAAALAAIIGVVPAVFLHLTFGAAYPAVLTQDVPLHWMVLSLKMPWLTFAYVAVLLGSLIDVAVGFIHSLNERIDGWTSERSGTVLRPVFRAGIAAMCLVLSMVVSLLGVVRLIAEGYGTLAWGFLLLFVLPLLTVGIYRMRKGAASLSSP
jgi:uncharacterized membrane protein YkvI